MKRTSFDIELLKAELRLDSSDLKDRLDTNARAEQRIVLGAADVLDFMALG